MSTALGTFEIVITWPDGRRERLPLSLIRLAHTSLPDDRDALRQQIAEWTRTTRELTVEELQAIEEALLECVHDEKSEMGLLNHIMGNGQLVDLGAMRDDSRGVRAVYIFALALRRFRLLRYSLGSVVKTIDIDANKDGV